MSSDEDSSDLMASFKRGNGSASAMRKQASVSPGMFFSEEESSAGENHAPTLRHQAGNRRVAVAVKVPPVRNRSDYTYYEPKQVVHRILREYTRKGEIMYEVELPNGRTRQVSLFGSRGERDHSRSELAPTHRRLPLPTSSTDVSLYQRLHSLIAINKGLSH
jgi:hypothetical protein